MGCDIHIITEIKKDGKWKYVPEIPNTLKDRNYDVFAALAGVRDSFDLQIFKPKGLPDDLSGMRFGFKSEMPYMEKQYREGTVKCFIGPDGNASRQFPSSKEIDSEAYNRLNDLLIVNKDVEAVRRYANLYWRESGGDRQYFVTDAYDYGGHFEDVPYSSLYNTFDEYAKDAWSDEYDAEADDYGYWSVNFDECGEFGDFHTPSWLTLKELLEADYSKYTAKKSKISKNLYDALVEAGAVWPNGFSIETSSSSDFMTALREAFEPTITVSWGASKYLNADSQLAKGINELQTIADIYGVAPENIRIVFCFDN